ncbi:DUF1763-domain-containing protein [Morchella conica CCBAS932]|uniref:DUF1763-domain-containing protein n=2 Tax=Morchella sect. Distantes TaxID=1051054 RepID=A0A3N4KVA7_9PEZI|nr:DUF1763-domain-containing protein [Morchella conica CCBAS932]
MPAPSTVTHAYRALYKAGLAAVQYSHPARYAIRDKLRAAFRNPRQPHQLLGEREQFSQERIDNTVEFLRTAARRKGVEHEIVRNLTMVHYWRVMRKQSRIIHGYESAYNSYNENIALLNESMGLELR